MVDIGVDMSQAAPGFDSPLQITSDILQMIVQRKVDRGKEQKPLIFFGLNRCFKRVKMS